LYLPSSVTAFPFEQAMDQFDRFRQTCRSLCTRDIQRGKLLGTISLAYSEVEPPAG